MAIVISKKGLVNFAILTIALIGIGSAAALLIQQGQSQTSTFKITCDKDVYIILSEGSAYCDITNDLNEIQNVSLSVLFPDLSDKFPTDVKVNSISEWENIPHPRYLPVYENQTYDYAYYDNVSMNTVIEKRSYGI